MLLRLQPQPPVDALKTEAQGKSVPHADETTVQMPGASKIDLPPEMGRLKTGERFLFGLR